MMRYTSNIDSYEQSNNNKLNSILQRTKKQMFKKTNNLVRMKLQ